MIVDLLFVFLGMLILLLLKGFFSGSEIALVSSDKIKLRHSAKQGHKGARLALDMLRNPDVLLSTTLVGTNLSTISLTTIGTITMINIFGDVGDLYAFLLFSPLFLVFGEIVPKSIYQQKSEALTPIIIYPLKWTSYIFKPLIFVFSRIARWVARLVGGGKREQTLFITREQLQALMELSEHSTLLSGSDRGRIKRVIRFAETTVAEAMIPIAEVTAISARQTTREAIQLVRKHGFNRLPVYDKSTADIRGVVTLSTWDLMDSTLPEQALQTLIKQPLFVSPLQTIDSLMPVLQKRKDHMAIVVDEFGATVGMITLEDIVEEVMGEIDVGYDFEEYLPRRKRTVSRLENGSYRVDARLPIFEVNELLSVNLASAEFHTVGGMIMARLRRIPKVEEYIIESGFRFTVEEASDRTITVIRIDPEL
ncbi:MAG: hemolysin family protein [Magnetospiraceae bacterium]